jgi:methylthioribulose-1-phosphate dehydratase
MSLLQSRLAELTEIKADLARKDWFPGTSGNLSIKVSGNPLTFLVTTSGKDKSKQTPEDFILVDEFCKPVEPTELKASAETGLHAEVYDRTDAGCCLHVHTIDNNLISELYAPAGQVIFRKQELIKAFSLWEKDAELHIPIIENYADLTRLTEVFGKAIRSDTPAVLIRNHGITVWGQTGFEAKKHLEAFEFLCSYQVKWHLLASTKLQFA